MQAIRKDRWTGMIFIGMMFLFFLFFFSKLYPIVISTTDDYYALANHRHVFPTWHGSQPIRVFAEVFMPLASQGASLLFRLFGGNIFDYLTFGYAFCVAAAMAGLVGVLYHMFRKAGVPALQTCAGLVIFLLMHFWIFKQRQQDGNLYMLYTEYACTYFYYVIPNLMNCILVVWLHTDRDVHELFRPGKYLKKGLFVLFAYFCIFSNIWAGAILAVYLGVRLVSDGIAAIRGKKSFRGWFREHYVILLLLIVWLVSQVFEMNGVRAAGIGQSISETFGNIWDAAMRMLRQVNIRYAFFCGLVIAGGLVFFILHKDWKSLALMGKLFAALVLFIVYFLLSCSKVGTYYVDGRPDVFYGAFFFGGVMVLICLFELLKSIPAVKLVLPFLILFILVECNSMGRTYKDSVVSFRGETLEQHRRVNQDILDQLQQAEAAGQRETKIYVPDYGNVDNWPYAFYANDKIEKCFYKFGALKEEITITEIVPDWRKNKEFGIALNYVPDDPEYTE